ncbi:hypothetical protein KV708_15725 [Comamonas thiooxydans]|uniref:hypothetical protein n=1 Tax=Comamonas thiooxydans TaxID=363952 RepID=UPI000A4A0AFF|nr:hypothetical protein [Comamonas thiooxydans]
MINWVELSSVAGTLGLFVAIFSLIISIKNYKSQNKSYSMNRYIHRSTEIDLKYVESDFMHGGILAKLVLFNPGPTAVIIQSLTLYKQTTAKFFLKRWLNVPDEVEIRNARWWPVSDATCKEPKYLHEEYKSIYVEDIRDIYVAWQGYRDDESKYVFLIQTNKGGYSTISTVSESESYFPHAYRKWYREK